MRQRMRYSFALAALVLVLAGLVAGRAVAEDGVTNSVTVADQELGDGNTVTIASVSAHVPGWLVVHADNNGSPGPVIGYAPVAAGLNGNVAVAIDIQRATRRLYAMLHVDAGQPGVYEFPGADGPARDANGNVVTPPFNLSANAVVVSNQIVYGDGIVKVARVLSKVEGWLVIHADNNGAPGPVLGHAHVGPGENYNVMVVIDTARMTDTMYAMLHVDAGEPYVYEFPGADGPARDVDGNVVTPPFQRVPNAVAVDNQNYGDDGTLTVRMILSSGPGWIVIHQEAPGGGVGPVAGHAPVVAGFNHDIQVEVNGDDLRPTMYAMLHTDAGVQGVYEFPGADGPVRDLNGNVITPPFTVLDY